MLEKSPVFAKGVRYGPCRGREFRERDTHQIEPLIDRPRVLAILVSLATPTDEALPPGDKFGRLIGLGERDA